MRKEINIHVGLMILKRRKELKLTQDQIANALNMARPAIVNIEKGKQGLSIESLLKIVKVLDCDISTILPLNGEVEIEVNEVESKPIKLPKPKITFEDVKQIIYDNLEEFKQMINPVF